MHRNEQRCQPARLKARWNQLCYISLTVIVFAKAVSVQGLLLNNKNEQTADACRNIDTSQKHHAKQRKPYRKEYMLCESIDMKLPEAWVGEGIDCKETVKGTQWVMEMFSNLIVMGVL